ncbi:YciI family protein [Lysobacter sp. BMK333-48F3]|uniref:YciI family protein n=1 Tax=Lysobacter sp. BMK333-48F3 TaxID=2867962 RepID=UPI001C8CB5DD|nr:YciI family protein [Lysobacter sp. BMK333-48F3]MBX9401256.1 YciI family protein [Lysobacter sp. BMK333-48F3]
MKFMLIVKADPDSESGRPPDPALLQAMGAYNQALVRAGVLLAAEGLRPSAQGARVHFDGAARRVIAGPFPETEQLVAGFWLIQARSLEEAVEWVKRVPNPDGLRSQIEIRRVFDTVDFDPAAEAEPQRTEPRPADSAVARPH